MYTYIYCNMQKSNIEQIYLYVSSVIINNNAKMTFSTLNVKNRRIFLCSVKTGATFVTQIIKCINFNLLFAVGHTDVDA